VFGAASVATAPDIVRLHLACHQNHPTPAAAFAATRESATAIRAALRARNVADKHISTSRLTLRTSWRSTNNGRTFDGYDCTVSFVVEVRDIDTFEQVLIDAVDAGANSVESVEFDVAAKKELRAQARREAVNAAREKAALYAEAANVQLGPVVHIEDVDAEGLQNTYRGHSSGYSGAVDSDLTPGRITVQAAVRIGFGLV
jgi:uncharacterized protein YggE